MAIMLRNGQPVGDVTTLLKDGQPVGPYQVVRAEYGPIAVSALNAKLSPFPIGLLTPRKPGDVEPQYWRNGAWLDMASVLESMRDRGFEPDTFDCKDGSQRDRPIACRSASHRLTLWLHVSRSRNQPYTLLIRDDANGVHVLPGRTVTGVGAVQTVDAFLAGLKLAADRAR